MSINIKIKPLLLVLMAMLFSNVAYSISQGTYILSNHPDGNAGAPGYGLRLDGFLTGVGSEIYTFDFDHASSAVTLVYDGTSIIIDGVAFGGQDVGSEYGAGTTALWDIHFEYLVGVTQPGGEGGLDDVVVDADYQNFGTISSDLGDFELSDKARPSDIGSFFFGDENGEGHRGFDGISGWGWLRHGADCTTGLDCENIRASDWLFTATPVTQVPVPAAAWLFGSALLGLLGIKRSKKS